MSPFWHQRTPPLPVMHHRTPPLPVMHHRTPPLPVMARHMPPRLQMLAGCMLPAAHACACR